MTHKNNVMNYIGNKYNVEKRLPDIWRQYLQLLTLKAFNSSYTGEQETI